MKVKEKEKAIQIFTKLQVPFFIWKSYWFEEVDDFQTIEEIIVPYDFNGVFDVEILKKVYERYTNGKELWEISTFNLAEDSVFEIEIKNGMYDIRDWCETLNDSHIIYLFNKANVTHIPVEYFNKPFDFLYKQLF